MAKVMTLINPRTDGTVVYRCGAGKEERKYVFEPDGMGNLVADVPVGPDLDAMLGIPAHFRRVPSVEDRAARARADAEAKEREEAERKRVEEQERLEREQAEEEAKAKAEADAKKKK